METKEFLRRLTEGAGVSGFEDGLVGAVREAFGPYTDEFTVDTMRNCVALRRGAGPEPRVKVMLAAHLDEIGLMVLKIDDRGFLRLAQVGGFDPRVLVGQEVWVHGRRTLPGVIGIKPPHIMSDEERRKAAKLEELFVDVGLGPDEVGEVVATGDTITLRRQLVELQDGIVSGKALDDRAGVACLLECMRRLAVLRHEGDVFAVATSQEEVGLKGAATSAYSIRPDVAVAIDVGHAGPGLPEHEALKLGKGPALTIGANIHPGVRALLVETAKACSIGYQEEVAAGATGTDAWAMQISREGIPTALLSIPLRYMHTSVETGSLDDVVASGRLLAEFCARVDRAFVEGLPWTV